MGCALLGVALAGCASRGYSRGEVMGLIEPVTEGSIPADQIVMVPIPPIAGITGDTTDGAILCAVNQQEFYRANGSVLPAYRPRRTQVEETDQHVRRVAQLRTDLAAVKEVLDRVFASVDGPEADGTNNAERKTLAQLLQPKDWKRLTDGIMTLTTGIDGYVREMKQPIEQRDGKTMVKERSDTLWAGLLPIADQIVAASDNLGRSGALAEAGADPQFSTDFQGRMSTIRRQAETLRGFVSAREATYIVPNLRLLQKHLDDLEISPVAGAAFGLAATAAKPFTREQRDESRDRLARVRVYLVRLASKWSEAQAKLLTDYDQPPTLVWEPATRLE